MRFLPQQILCRRKNISKFWHSGKLIGGFCALSGVFILTLPIPIVVNSFAQFYKNRLWRNEVEHKKRERTVHLAAEKRAAQRGSLDQVWNQLLSKTWKCFIRVPTERRLFWVGWHHRKGWTMGRMGRRPVGSMGALRKVQVHNIIFKMQILKQTPGSREP